MVVGRPRDPSDRPNRELQVLELEACPLARLVVRQKAVGALDPGTDDPQVMLRWGCKSSRRVALPRIRAGRNEQARIPFGVLRIPQLFLEHCGDTSDGV